MHMALLSFNKVITVWKHSGYVGLICFVQCDRKKRRSEERWKPLPIASDPRELSFANSKSRRRFVWNPFDSRNSRQPLNSASKSSVNDAQKE